MTFEEYLLEAQEHQIIDFMLRATLRDDGIQFYIYPHGKNGNTVDFKVEGNNLIPINQPELEDNNGKIKSIT